MGPLSGVGRGSVTVSSGFGSSCGSEAAALTDPPVSSQHNTARVIPEPSTDDDRLRLIRPFAPSSVVVLDDDPSVE